MMFQSMYTGVLTGFYCIGFHQARDTIPSVQATGRETSGVAGGDFLGAEDSVEADHPIHLPIRLGASEMGISYKGIGKYEAVYDYDYAGGSILHRKKGKGNGNGTGYETMDAT